MSEKKMRVAYLVNQYPTVSHSFIRREILSLERQGVEIDRISLRGWDVPIVDEEDVSERKKTWYVQRRGLPAIIWDATMTAVSQPSDFFMLLFKTFGLARRSRRAWPYHIVYLAQACRIHRRLRNRNVQHLHAHFGTNPAEVALFVKELGGPKFSFTIHGQDEIEGAQELNFFEKISGSDFTLAVSAYCRSQIMRELEPSIWNKIKILHCGLDESYFCETPLRTPSVTRFLCVGRLSPEKGHLVLLEAFQGVANKYPKAELVIAGDGPMRTMIESEITKRDLEGRVSVTGWLDSQEVKSEIDSATALVQPSFIEGLPVVIMEAMARGRVVISTYVAGIPELVQHGVNGWLAPAGDSKALSLAMEKVAQLDEETLKCMGQDNIVRVKERHLIDNETRKLKSLILGQDA